MRRGFTFIELIIYLGIFVVLSGIFASVLVTFTKLESQQLAETELNHQLNFALQKIQNLITASSTAAVYVNDGTAPQDQDRGSTNTTLVVRRSDHLKDPTKIYINGNGELIMDENGAANPLTVLKNVKATNVIFKKSSNYPGHDLVQINLSLQSQSPAPNNIVRTILSTVGRASAATFDDDVYPVAGGKSIGIPTSKWQNGYFSSILKTDVGLQMTSYNPRTSYSCAGISPANKGLMILEAGATGASPTSDQLYICMKNSADDNYSWRKVNIP